MNKVIKAEIKKMVSKPGIYVLAIFLAVILVLGVFLYKPNVTKEESLPTLTQTTMFDGKGQYKDAADNKITNAANAVAGYLDSGISANEKMYGKDGKSGLWANYQACYRAMSIQVNNPSTDINALIDQFIASVKDINTLIMSSVNSGNQDLAHKAITTTSNYNNYTSLYKSIIDSTGTDGVFGLPSNNENTPEYKIDKYNRLYKTKFENAVSGFTFPILSANKVKDYSVDEEGTKLNIVKTRLNLIYADMEKLKETGLDKKAMEQYNVLANRYINTANVYHNLVKYELMSNAFDYATTSDKLSLRNLESYSEYNSDTLLIKYTYLFDHDKVESDYANPLAVGSTITTKTTTFDYTFFILKLFSFIIIAYAIMSACGAIAGEIKEGSMRYYAIRPISRNNILFGKLISILVMSTIILLFSTIIALCVGVGVYGWTNLSILTIFNGSTAMVINPLLMIFVYVLSFVIELTVYTSIALLLSCLLKSDLLAATLMLLLYLLNIILPVFAGGMNSWLAFYPFSHITLFSLFGSSIVATGNNMLHQLLSVNVYANTTLILTVVVTALLIAIPIYLSTVIFKRKEL